MEMHRSNRKRDRGGMTATGLIRTGFRSDQARIERLEPRRLLTASLDYNSTSRTLTLFDNSTGADSGITVTTLSASGVLALQISDSEQEIIVDGSAGNLGWGNGSDSNSAIGPDNGTVQKIEILTGDGSDFVDLESAAGGTGFAPPAIDVSSEGDAEVTISRASIPQSLGAVAVHNDGGETSLEIDDSMDTTPRTVTTSSSSITGLLDDPVTFDGTVSQVAILAGTGGDTFVVQGTPPPGPAIMPDTAELPTSFLDIDSMGSDTFDVQATGVQSRLSIESEVPTSTENVLISDHGSVQNILGQTDVDSVDGESQGTFNLTIDASADNIPQSVDISTDPDSQFEFVDGLAGEGVEVNRIALGQFTVKTGAGADQFNLEQDVGALNGASTTIDTGAGNDTVNVFSTPVGGTLAIDGQGGQDKVNVTDFKMANGTVLDHPVILGPINIADTGGSVEVYVDDSAGQSGRTASVSDTGIVGLTTAEISFEDASRVDLTGSSASDAFSVDPSEITAFHLDAGPFNSVGGSVAADTLTLNLNLATGITVTAPNASEGSPGEYNFSNLQPVFFTRFATVSPSLGSIAGTVVNGDNQTPVVGAVVFIDSNGNGSPDSGEPTTSTDAMGDFAFNSVTAGSYTLVQVPPAGLIASTPATVSSTVTLGAAAPVNFIDVLDPTHPLTGSITGSVVNGASPTAVAGAVVFIDSNGNGNPDAGEPSTSTDATGAFHFDSIVAGSYSLVEVVPAGLIASTPATVSVTVISGQATSVKFVDIPAPTPGGPDLTASFVGAFPASVLSGSKGKGKLRIINQGAAISSSGTQVSLYASSDPALSGGDTLITTFSTGPLKLKSGGSKVIPINFSFPSAIADGSYFLLASVDSSNQIMESDESNNTTATASAVVISAPFVDLAGRFGTLPAALASGKNISLPLTIQNLGNLAATGTIDVDLFASSDATLDETDKSLATNIPVKINIKPGKSQNVKLRIPAGTSFVAGSDFLIANINTTQLLGEMIFSNNTIVSGSTIALS